MASDTALRACTIATLGSAAGGVAEVPAEVAPSEMGEERDEEAAANGAGEPGACAAPSANGRVRCGGVAEAGVKGVDGAVAAGRESAPLWISLRISPNICGERFAAVKASMRLDGGEGEGKCEREGGGKANGGSERRRVSARKFLSRSACYQRCRESQREAARGQPRCDANLRAELRRAEVVKWPGDGAAGEEAKTGRTT